MRRLLGLPVLVLFAVASFSSVAVAGPKEDKAAQEQAKKDEKAKKDAEKKAAEQAKKDGKKVVAKKNDPNEIGNRETGKGINFYSIEKEIAMGKSLAQEVERQAKIVDDPIIAEYVNRVGQNIVRNSDAQVPFTIKVVEDESAIRSPIIHSATVVGQVITLIIVRH